MVGQRQFVGLRLSDAAGAVPTADQMQEGELAFNTADGRLFVRFGSAVRELTDSYSQSDIDQLLADKLDSDNRYTDAEAVAAAQASPEWRATEWDTAYGWGDHALAGYLTSVTWGAVGEKPTTYPPATHSHSLSDITDAGTAAASDADEFDPAGSAAQAENRIRETLRQRPDPLLMHFL